MKTKTPRRTLWSDLGRLTVWVMDHPVTGYLVAFGLGVAYTLAALDI